MSDYDIDFDATPSVTRYRRGQQTTIRGRLSRQDAGAVIAMLDDTIHNFVSTFGISERFPSQPPKSSVLLWEHKFEDDGKTYTYVALHVGGSRWYVTGKRNEILTWEELVPRIGNDKCWLLAKHTEIPQTKSLGDNFDDPILWAEAMFGANKTEVTETPTVADNSTDGR